MPIVIKKSVSIGHSNTKYDITEVGQGVTQGSWDEVRGYLLRII